MSGLRVGLCLCLCLWMLSHGVFAADVPWLAEVQRPPQGQPDSPLSPLWDSTTELTREAWELRRRELQQAWLQWLGPMPERPTPTTWTVLRTDELSDVTRQLVEYAGEPDWKVQAYILRPSAPLSGRKRAGVVVLHSTTTQTIDLVAGVTNAREEQTGLQLAQRGFVVVCPRCFLWQDAPDLMTAVEKHRERHPRTLGMMKMLYDAQRAVDLLVAQPDVDPQRIGACGHSLGAKEAFYLAAFDERVKAAVASDGGIPFTSTNWQAPWYLGPDVRRPDQPRNHHELVALIAPRAFLVLAAQVGPGAADGDHTWPYLAAALPVYRLYGETAPLGLLNHREGHRLSQSSYEKLAEWLETYLP